MGSVRAPGLLRGGTKIRCTLRLSEIAQVAVATPHSDKSATFVGKEQLSGAPSRSSSPSGTGGELTDAQIDWVIDAYTRGAVADEQMSALAMAILLNGMNRARDRPLDRGDDRLAVSGWTSPALSRPTADKHSTGGVGDKITLPLAPLVAACGVAVPQLSGRGLGHTGGTLDKLESIPGWRAALTTRRCWPSSRTSAR